jgi:hypothetical protein
MMPDWVALRLALEGTVINEVPEDMAEMYGIPAWDHEQVVEAMLDQGIEQCPECGCWVESGEILINVESDEVEGCEACV